MSKNQQAFNQPAPPKAAPASSGLVVPEGMVPAYFTPRELLELRKICRDSDGELGSRFLADAIKRADRS